MNDLEPITPFDWGNTLEQLNALTAIDLDADVDVADLTKDEITPPSNKRTATAKLDIQYQTVIEGDTLTVNVVYEGTVIGTIHYVIEKKHLDD